MTPIGYSARIPPAGTGNSLADINSDIAFKGKLQMSRADIDGWFALTPAFLEREKKFQWA